MIVNQSKTLIRCFNLSNASIASIYCFAAFSRIVVVKSTLLFTMFSLSLSAAWSANRNARCHSSISAPHSLLMTKLLLLFLLLLLLLGGGVGDVPLLGFVVVVVTLGLLTDDDVWMGRMGEGVLRCE